jgi:cytochrome c biogenesis protein CcmG/thiol:disulfide interchange protein DsbE
MELAKNDNLEVIGINYKDTKKNANNFLKDLGNPYDNIIFDIKGTNAIEWGAYGVPESFLINNNKIIKKYIGPLNKGSMQEIKSFIK